jgi:hypothetical protein
MANQSGLEMNKSKTGPKKVSAAGGKPDTAKGASKPAEKPAKKEKVV